MKTKFPYISSLVVDQKTKRCFEVRDKRDENWLVRWRALEAFATDEGHANVPRSWAPDRQLAKWVLNQRSVYRAGRLDGDRKRLLERLSFVWDPYEAAWLRGLDIVVAFQQAHGHCSVPESRYPALANWVRHQREAMRKGRLRAAWVQKLEALGLESDPSKASEASWRALFGRLKAFKATYGHSNVPHRWAKDKSLGGWVFEQRVAYRAGTLSKGRAEALERLGMLWRPREDVWKAFLRCLMVYKAEFGHTNVPIRWKRDRSLSVWVARQRVERRLGRLSASKTAALDNLGFSWQLKRSKRARINVAGRVK